MQIIVLLFFFKESIQVCPKHLMIKKTLLVLIGSMGKQMPNPLFGVGAAFCTTTKLLILWVYSLSNIFFWIPILCSWHSHKTLNHTRRYIVSFAKNRHESRLIWWHHLSRSYHLWCGISGGGVSRCLHQVNRYRIKYMSLLGLRRQIHKLKAGSSRIDGLLFEAVIFICLRNPMKWLLHANYTIRASIPKCSTVISFAATVLGMPREAIGGVRKTTPLQCIYTCPVRRFICRDVRDKLKMTK